MVSSLTDRVTVEELFPVETPCPPTMESCLAASVAVSVGQHIWC